MKPVKDINVSMKVCCVYGDGNCGLRPLAVRVSFTQGPQSVGLTLIDLGWPWSDIYEIEPNPASNPY